MKCKGINKSEIVFQLLLLFFAIKHVHGSSGCFCDHVSIGPCDLSLVLCQWRSRPWTMRHLFIWYVAGSGVNNPDGNSVISGVQLRQHIFGVNTCRGDFLIPHLAWIRNKWNQAHKGWSHFSDCGRDSKCRESLVLLQYSESPSQRQCLLCPPTDYVETLIIFFLMLKIPGVLFSYL